MKEINKYLVIVFFLFITGKNLAQTTLYGIKNIGMTYKFVGIDCSNDSVTEMMQIPLNFYTTNFSSTYDPRNHVYYYCTGQIMFIIDALSGTMIDTFDFSNIHPAYLLHVVYNPKDGYIYGVKRQNATFVENFTRFDPSNGTLTDISTLTQPLFVANACKGVIDVSSQEYILQSTLLTAIDISSGNILFNYPIQNVANETFDHIAFSCKYQQVYGLSNNPHVPEEYLAIADTNNAIVSHIDPAPLPVLYYKQYLSGCSIDNTSDVLYYSATGGYVYGIDIHTGNIAYSHNYGPGFEFLFLESAADYSCEIEAAPETISNNFINIYPNPFTSEFSMQLPQSNDDYDISLYDILGQRIFHEKMKAHFTVDTKNILPGFYLLSVQNELRRWTKRIIKN